MKRSRILGIIFATFIAANMFAGCGKKQQAEVNKPLTPVEAYKAAKGGIKVIHTVSGQVKAASEVQIFPPTSGKVLNVHKEIGDMTVNGDVLFSLDKEDLQRQLDSALAQAKNSNASYEMERQGYDRTKEGGTSRKQKVIQSEATLNQTEASLNQAKSGFEQAEAGLRQAETRKANAQTDYDKNKPLFESGAISKQAMDSYERELTNAKIGYESALNNYNIAQRAVETAQRGYDNAADSHELVKKELLAEGQSDAQLRVQQASAGVDASAVSIKNIRAAIADSDVKSTIAGIIASKGVEKGGFASVQSPAYTIVDIDSVTIEASVTEQVINRITKGQEVTATIKALDGKQFKGVIDSFSPAITGQSIGYPVKVTIKNDGHVIKPGMFAEIEFAIQEKNGVLLIPMESVLNEKGKTVVYVLDGQTARKKEVKVGIKDGKNYEVTEGANEGEMVIVKGQQFVKDGEQVQLVWGAQ